MTACELRVWSVSHIFRQNIMFKHMIIIIIVEIKFEIQCIELVHRLLNIL